MSIFDNDKEYEVSVVKELASLARKEFVYMSYGEWDGSPEKLDDLNLGNLYKIRYMLDLCIREIERNNYEQTN